MVFYQPCEYYLFEQPEFDKSGGDACNDGEDDPFRRLTVLYNNDQTYSKKLKSLDIFGTIKTVYPSEYFLCDGKATRLQMLKIDANHKEKIYTAEVKPLIDDLGQE